MTSLTSPAILSSESIPLRIPVELWIEIFSRLCTFTDVFALANTSRQLKDVWSDNASTIYGRVAPRCISCERDAHRFLARQCGFPEMGLLRSTEHIVRLEKNNRIIEKAIRRFEQAMIPHMGIGIWNGFIYGKQQEDRNWHPPHLTCRERARFVRLYYDLWTLMEMDPAEWQPMLEATKLKRLILLNEMVTLPQRVGSEEIIPQQQKWKEGSRSYFFNYRYSAKRKMLTQKIEDHTYSIYKRTHDRDFGVYKPYQRGEGSAGYHYFVAFWDFWQEELDWTVHCRYQPSYDQSPTRRSFDPSEVWESSDEEFQA